MSAAFPLPSQKLNRHKQASVWGVTKHKTPFSAAYARNDIPCRINHGGVKSGLIWTIEPSTLNFDPLLVDCCAGFAETQHPYVFLARRMFFELLDTPSASSKLTTSVLNRIVPILRRSLSSKQQDEVQVAIEAIGKVAELTGDAFTPYFTKILVPLSCKLRIKSLAALTRQTIFNIAENGGDSVKALIKKKVPSLGNQF